MSECKQRKQHFLKHDETAGFRCLICGLVGDMDAIHALPCESKEDRAASAQKAARTAQRADERAESLQLIEYLDALEREEKQLRELMVLQELEKEEAGLRALLKELEVQEAQGPQSASSKRGHDHAEPPGPAKAPVDEIPEPDCPPVFRLHPVPQQEIREEIPVPNLPHVEIVADNVSCSPTEEDDSTPVCLKLAPDMPYGP